MDAIYNRQLEQFFNSLNLITEMEINNEFLNLIKSKNFRHYFILYSSIFISSIIISTIIGLKFINIPDYAIFFVKNFTSLRYGDGGMISIFLNNIIVSIFLMLNFYLLNMGRYKNFLGQFYFLYMGTIAGLAISKVALKYDLVIAVSMILPHGIVEIPTIIFAISSGWVLSELKNKKDFNRKSKILFICIFLILFFLLGLAAYIESYITPNIFNMLISKYH